jgi:hypothetical protein
VNFADSGTVNFAYEYNLDGGTHHIFKDVGFTQAYKHAISMVETAS